MKIFDWVRRRFCNKDSEGLAESGKKMSCVIEGDAGVFDGWEQGILTIGTLGYDALKQQDEEYYSLEADKQNESDAEFEDSEEESNPLVYAYEEEFLEMKRDPEGDDEEFDAMIYKKERITLAELFSADSEMGGKEEYKSSITNYKLHGGGFSFAKKDIARPIHKLRRLMRMMLKRKIHPDEGLNSTKIETASLLPAQDAII